MEQDAATYMELPEGRMVVYQPKSKADLIKEAEELMAKAEGYGATKISEFREGDKDKFREIMKLLGQDIRF